MRTLFNRLAQFHDNARIAYLKAIPNADGSMDLKPLAKYLAFKVVRLTIFAAAVILLTRR